MVEKEFSHNSHHVWRQNLPDRGKPHAQLQLKGPLNEVSRGYRFPDVEEVGAGGKLIRLSMFKVQTGVSL